MADSGQSNVPFERYDQWMTFILANLAWVMFAIPIITLPLGMVGLFQVMSLWTRNKQPEFFRDFFGAMRKYWLKSLIIGVIDVAAAGLTVANLIILNMMGFRNPFVLMLGSMTVFLALLLLMANMYIWSLLVVAEFDLKRIFVLSFKLVFAHPFVTFATLIASLLPIALVVLLSLPPIIILLGLISLSALMMNKGTWHIIRRYVPEAELLEYESQN